MMGILGFLIFEVIAHSGPRYLSQGVDHSLKMAGRHT